MEAPNSMATEHMMFSRSELKYTLTVIRTVNFIHKRIKHETFQLGLLIETIALVFYFGYFETRSPLDTLGWHHKHSLPVPFKYWSYRSTCPSGLIGTFKNYFWIEPAGACYTACDLSFITMTQAG